MNDLCDLVKNVESLVVHQFEQSMFRMAAVQLCSAGKDHINAYRCFLELILSFAIKGFLMKQVIYLFCQPFWSKMHKSPNRAAFYQAVH